MSIILDRYANRVAISSIYPVNEIVNHREHILHIRKSALGKKVLDECLLMPIMYIHSKNNITQEYIGKEVRDVNKC